MKKQTIALEKFKVKTVSEISYISLLGRLFSEYLFAHMMKASDLLRHPTFTVHTLYHEELFFDLRF